MKTYINLILLSALVFAGCGGKDATPSEKQDETLTIGVMPKLVGIGFFNAAKRGIEEAGRELNVNVDYDGPTTGDVEQQSRLADTWIARKYDAIAIAPNDPDAIAPVLARARARGIKVVAWDADAQKDARDWFINQATSESVARSLMDVMAEGAGEDAKYIIITGSLTAANQNIWMEEMEKYRQERYPDMVNLTPTPIAPGEDQARATQMAADALKTYTDLDGIFAITSVALPGAAEALRRAGAADKVFLTGLATPNDMREYVKEGTVKRFVLWNPVDLGYLAVQAAVASARGELAPGAEAFEAGRLGVARVTDDQILLGPPMIFDNENIDDFDF
ncbi:MAG TPA: autoinducer 2 ABC transporter substrate-binding protein [Candidatus Hydrogenedentes bacterium]|nr:autoinducer 2 ABC transporter substrate-binding protein [Candidatus Hydrogenedentota bacterium]